MSSKSLVRAATIQMMRFNRQLVRQCVREVGRSLRRRSRTTTGRLRAAHGHRRRWGRVVLLCRDQAAGGHHDPAAAPAGDRIDPSHPWHIVSWPYFSNRPTVDSSRSRLGGRGAGVGEDSRYRDSGARRSKDLFVMARRLGSRGCGCATCPHRCTAEAVTARCRT